MTRDEPSPPTVTVRSPTFDERAHPRFILPTRMGYRWRHFNHRIAAWKFGLLREPDGHPWADRLRTHSVGGPYSNELLRNERPEVKFGYQRIDADSVENLGAARRRLDLVIDASGVRTVTRRFDRDALHLSGYRTVTAAVTGFGFDTDIPQPTSFPNGYQPSHGYLTQGLGVDIRVSELTEDSVEVTAWIRYGFGAAMDRPRHNAALLEARVGATLDIALVGVTDAPVHRGRISYGSEYGEPKIGVGRQIDSVPKRLKRIRIDGTPSAPAGFVGLQSFNFDLTPTDSCRWNRNWPLGDGLRGGDGGHPEYGTPGYYLRELTVDLSRERFDRETGRGSFLLDGFASNSTFSIPFHPLTSEFSGRMVWIQAPVVSRSVAFSTEFPTGASQFALDEME